MSRSLCRTLLTTGVLFITPLTAADEPLAVRSPSDAIEAAFALTPVGRPQIAIRHGGADAATVQLGLSTDGGRLRDGLRIAATERTSRDRAYAIPVGKASRARDVHNELRISLRGDDGGRGLEVVIRVFDDAVAFRTVIATDDRDAAITLLDEETTFTFPGDPAAHALPLKDFTTPYEAYYSHGPLSALSPGQLIGLPLLMEAESATWLALTEANLKDYAGMYLTPVEGQPGTLVSTLSPLLGRDDGAKVIRSGPLASPWRVVMIADDPGRLIESDVVFHLSEPSRIEDTSWIKPGKTLFPWWNGYSGEGIDFDPAVDDRTMRHYIDFAAEHGIPYHSLDGLDVAWYGGPIRPNGPTDVTTGNPNIDLPALAKYAKDRGVRLRLWMHWEALKPQIDEAFAYYETLGIEGVMVDFMNRDDQEMVAFYHEMAEKAAEHHLTVTLHGAYKPTGMERTWPNVLSYEAVLNQEYNKFRAGKGRGTPPSHNLDAAFVRMLAGPLDYHQGGMRNVAPKDLVTRSVAPPVPGTRGHQLAQYVVYLNHLPMMADTPAAYAKQPELSILVDIPANWDETRVLHADFRRCLVIARRSGETWYLGGMAAEEECDVTFSLDFLGNEPHEAEFWSDVPAAGPTTVERSIRSLSPGKPLRVRIPPSGGFVARLTPND